MRSFQTSLFFFVNEGVNSHIFTVDFVHSQNQKHDRKRERKKKKKKKKASKKKKKKTQKERKQQQQ